jgi:hypothetical protein
MGFSDTGPRRISAILEKAPVVMPLVIAHAGGVLHCNVTRHPISVWVSQQLREAFPDNSASGYLVFDHAANSNGEVVGTITSFGIQPNRTSFRSPWQNGVAEHWVGNCKCDLLDHVIVLNERHLKRLMGEYIRYCHDVRTGLALEKQNAQGGVAATDPEVSCEVVSMPRLGGLHHRYELAS